ncbi:phosphopyruvate hydratase [bacterium]|nr:phosphopyruvate hydratase [bacterium]
MADRIRAIKAREILDSRANPTLEVELETTQGRFLAGVPSGASTGKHEAVELRDGGKRYGGKGVLKAVRNVNKVIAPKLIGKDPTEQEKIDRIMKKLDGTRNKSRLGANAICGVSLAVCRAGAAAVNLPLYLYIRRLFNPSLKKPVKLPKPCFNVINGGAHACNDLDFQEFMIVPQFKKTAENVRAASEVYHKLKEIIIERYMDIGANVGDEGGFAPGIRFPEEALDLIEEAKKRAGYKRREVKVILDVASSAFFSKGKYITPKTKMDFTRQELADYYYGLLKKYPIIALEDPFAQDDWEGWEKLNQKSKIKNQKLLIIGDDLLVTNPSRIKEAKRRNACNGLLLKVNQIGTLSEALEAARLAKAYNWKIMVSHRSGETCDDFISDLAVGISAEFIKSGAPARGERTAKYNRLLKIEEEIKNL